MSSDILPLSLSLQPEPGRQRIPTRWCRSYVGQDHIQLGLFGSLRLDPVGPPDSKRKRFLLEASRGNLQPFQMQFTF